MPSNKWQLSSAKNDSYYTIENWLVIYQLTLGWKDPPSNSILALPSGTHQDQPQNEQNKAIIKTKIDSSVSHNRLDRNKNVQTDDEIKLLPTLLRTNNGIINRNFGNYKLKKDNFILNESRSIEKGSNIAKLELFCTKIKCAVE